MMDFDLVIVGGGLVGSSLACALRHSGLRVGVVEAVAANAPSHPSYDERVLALSLGSRRIFGGIGLWDAMRADAEPIRQVHVSERGQFGFARLAADEEGVEALGYVTPARSIGQALEACLRDATDTVEVMRPARLVGLRQQPDGWNIEISVAGSSRLLRTALLVAADGGDSALRRRLGLAVHEQAYGYDAIITTVTPGRPRPGVAFERFTDSGPLAMLPMTGGRWSVVWTARDSDTAGLLALDDTAFLQALQQRFGHRLGRLARPGRRIAYPLRLLLAKQLTGPRLALIGNAAHTLHPVAGQGFNLGLRDVAELADLLADTRRTGQDPGGHAVLAGYRQRRRQDQANVAALTDGLARLFTNPLPTLRLGRNLGLLGLDLLPPARHALARRFMGIGGRLPRLARGLPLDGGQATHAADDSARITQTAS
ncbi:2-octaprenyl-6-methoxyphenyl hydroxylase [Thiohalocapsa marina]|uniref:2-octaprenyl-6-methoxyphenyl hydroxylase n=1 Tax=Thiohalocapsa marina TaxID=424902 RepID=A0A5M8FU58_9GAMM|nr:2-octaprenyl-6-methoxyphenyl hydroxylase [Thiohalocapsa marina]KAA6187342.1 2-octaprenyl-6-methoxyphenyl hydroxylase [Thiohalocapsa marina]